jgi:hypothetical protein
MAKDRSENLENLHRLLDEAWKTNSVRKTTHGEKVEYTIVIDKAAHSPEIFAAAVRGAE